jgi:hypothetical protein
VDDVVLRDVADAAAERVVDRVQVLAVDAHLPARRRQVPVERKEKRRLAGPGRAHERDHVSRERFERNVIEQHLHPRLVVAVRHFEKQVPRLDLVKRLARPVGLIFDDDVDPTVAEVNQERHRADEDLLAAIHGDALAGREALAAHERAVGAAAILEKDLVPGLDDLRVLGAHLGVVDDDLVVGRAADRDDA